MNDNPSAPVNISILFAVWILAVAILLLRTLVLDAGIPLVSDTDDAMRLAMVQDFLNGQNWFDHVQHRLNVPHGGNIHWSRLVDLPIAGLVLLFSPFTAFGDPLVIAATAWPLILLLILLTIVSRLAIDLVGPQGQMPAIVLTLFSTIVFAEFEPGRVDHHNVQIVLTAALALATTRAFSKPSWAVATGLIAATSLAIGTEALPIIVASIASLSLGYVFDRLPNKSLALFGLSFAIGGVVHLIVALPPADWFKSACDALSIVYVQAALGVGAVLAALELLNLRLAWQRFGLGLALGGGLVVALVMTNPLCLEGPYAGMEPWLKENWLARITEARPAWESLDKVPGYVAGVIAPPLLALLVLVGLIVPNTGRDAERKTNWLVLGLFLLLAVAVGLLQIRGARLAAALVGPFGAWAIVHFRQRYFQSGSVLPLLGVVASWLLFSGLVVSLLTDLLAPKGLESTGATVFQQADSAQAMPTEFDCLQPEAFDILARYPAQPVMAPVHLGAHIILHTEHSVVGAPYHRVQDGVSDVFKFFNSSPSSAHMIAEIRNTELLVTCPAMGEMAGFADTPTGALLNALKSENLPSWLVDVTPEGSVLKIYEIEFTFI